MGGKASGLLFYHRDVLGSSCPSDPRPQDNVAK